MVERELPKLEVAGSTPVVRFPSVLRHAKKAMLSAAIGLTVAAVGCGDGVSTAEAGADRQLTPVLTKRALRTLPYRYEFREVPLPEGASGAVAGRAFGKHRTYLDFGIALGEEALPVPVPQAGATDVARHGDFIFTANVIVEDRNGHFVTGKQLHTQAQWLEANSMVVEMEGKLCRAITGRPCPV